MIEINLVPDVKQELIKAKRVQTLVISGAVLVGVAAIVIVVLLALYSFGVQTLRSNAAESDITKKSQDLSNVSDLANTLTIQHQLTALTALHDNKNLDSRFFDLLAAINPDQPNSVTFSSTHIDADSKTIRLEGQAANGYTAADVLKKTIIGTTLNYKVNGESKSTQLTSDVSMSDLSYGEDATGSKVLRFTMQFVYDSAFFSRTSENATILRPDRQNATDSFLRLPESLFSDRAATQGGGN
jgi:hypothetical protein